MIITLFLGTLLGAIIVGIPIAISLLIAGVAIMWQSGNFDSQIIASNIINGIDNFIFLAIPFFILAGELMNSGGLSRRIVNMAIAFLGHLRGGLGYVVILASALIASLSGSAIADSAAMAALLLPMMREAGYDEAKSVGLVAAGGIIGPIIPPSIGLIMYGVIANLSITKLFMGGIAPGIFMGLALAVVWRFSSRNMQVRLYARSTRKETLVALKNGLWAMGLPVIVLGGLRTGIFTPTESAAIAVGYALFVGCFIYRELTLKKIYESLVISAKINGMVMFIVGAAFVSAWVITVSDVATELGDWLGAIDIHPKLLLLLMMGIVMIVGTALDFAPMILILTPIMLPIAKSIGIDPIYFGVLFVMSVSIGLLTPPVGNVLNVVASISKVEFFRIARGVLPFLLSEVAVIVLLVIFPDLFFVPLRWIY